MKKFVYAATALLVFATCSASTIAQHSVTISDKTTTQPKPSPGPTTDSQDTLGPPSCDRGAANGCGIFD